MLKRFTGRLRQMSRPAYIMLKAGVCTALVMLCVSLLTIAAFGDMGIYAFRRLKEAFLLYDGASGVLMLGVILSAALEYKSL